MIAFPRSARRAAAAAVAAIVMASAPAVAQEATDTALVEINQYFNAIDTMRGEFVQFGPDGSRTQGRFAISRPGKVRFFYDRPSTLDIIADGTSVAVRDRRRNTQDIWPLSKTPLRFLLDNTIDLTADAKVTDVEVAPDLISVRIEEDTAFGEGALTLLFDSQSKELKQWNVVDGKGQETSVSIYNVSTGVDVDKDLFEIDYQPVIGESGRRSGR
ncbi:outer-membrane lipoprotein carrier protein LolA [Acuticoccus sp. I52.16.1]|uniref:LolA family protein n=1 Tax=Acuticoccus sp. I52.16.1 TaxID=2928472 RepID=UPI001FD55A91|nr:outer-membrane lipoprotein carrier protein LolA [Acuticoccus sp. I52.16.1]UOM33575.1 outer membrane lipoprotein carrier protein LolA [Acuticoccus sp. I52.16.1]